MSLQGALAEATRQGKELECGETAVTASVAITTNFADIDAVVVTRKTGSAPGDTAAIFTYDVSDNVVTIYAWMPTSGTDYTQVANDTEVDVSYVILGRRRK